MHKCVSSIILAIICIFGFLLVTGACVADAVYMYNTKNYKMLIVNIIGGLVSLGFMIAIICAIC